MPMKVIVLIVEWEHPFAKCKNEGPVNIEKPTKSKSTKEKLEKGAKHAQSLQ